MGLIAMACYWRTLLPGLDFGDTASFQTGVGSLTLTPRQAYPLYYGLGNIVAWLDPREPAHAMNLASAIYGTIASALAVLVTAEVCGSIAGGAAAGLFLAFSYTFWTQAIIAEVYTLHLLIVGLCLLAIFAWQRNPTLGRLCLFYAIYALGFGNHLSMILLLPGFAVFILMCRPGGTSDPLSSTAIGLALAIAAAGALQYAWNFRGLWLSDMPPANLADAFGKFWFDVTKSDWRETLVMNVSSSGLQNRPAMYWFDLHQQFGTPGLIIASAGSLFVLYSRFRIGVLLLLLYAANLVFAWTYNVGDVHVFFLPSHYVIAIWIGAGVAALQMGSGTFFAGHLEKGTRHLSAAFAAACIAYALWRGYDTFPAVDRSWDHRPEQLLETFLTPHYPRYMNTTSIFGMDANWQVQNAAEYIMRRHPGVPWFTFDDLAWLKTGDVTARFQHFEEQNVRAGRDTVVTPVFAQKLKSAGYRGGFSPMELLMPPTSDLTNLPAGTTYVLTVLRPDREFPLDREELIAIWESLTRSTAALPALSDYTVIAGTVGGPPDLIEGRNRPFRIHTHLGLASVDVRMESWLPTDTIRRAGFGHVVVNRQHALTIERGVSLVALGLSSQPVLTAYRSSLFAPLPQLRPWAGPLRNH